MRLDFKQAPKPAVWRFADIAVGTEARFEVVITPEMVERFSVLTGDYNPLHTDAVYAAQTPLGAPLVHGLLAGSFFSALVGMHLPGQHALYLSQKFLFRRPIFFGTAVHVRGVVVERSEATQTITLSTQVLDAESGDCYIDGEAVVKVLR